MNLAAFQLAIAAAAIGADLNRTEAGLLWVKLATQEAPSSVLEAYDQLTAAIDAVKATRP